MRSSRSLALVVALVLAVLLGACGTDRMPRDGDPTAVDPAQCQQSYLDYGDFGAPFMLDWCRGCHSAAIPTAMRQSAPTDVNFDTLDEVRTFKDRIAQRAASTTPTMPPAGGPGSDERALLAEWIACGAK